MKKIAFCNYYNELNINNLMFENMNTSIGDDLFYSMHVLAKYAESKGVEVGTTSLYNCEEVDAFVFLDLPEQNNQYFNYALKNKVPCYLAIFESEIIRPDNWDKKYHLFFRKIFTWHDPIVDNKKYFKINFSGKLTRTPSSIPFLEKKICTIIAGNKMVNHPLELYSERVRVIRWFEKNHLQDLDLYGIGWDRKYFIGFFKKLNRFKKLCQILLFKKFSSYKGVVNRKRDVLNKYKFSLCFENAKDIDGYITEKIFDCLKNGVVPIYYGPKNILDHIPESLFVDYSKFSSLDELYSYMKNFTEEQYHQFIKSTDDFFASKKSFPFSSEYFAQTIVDQILN